MTNIDPTQPPEFEAALPSQDAVFSELTTKMAAIALNASLAPSGDVALHQTALLNAYGRAYEYLQSEPSLVTYYRTLGSFLTEHADETIEQHISSSEQLKTYVEQGLLDSLTIEEIEAKLEVARAAVVRRDYLSVYEELFANAVEAEQPDATKEQAHTPPSDQVAETSVKKSKKDRVTTTQRQPSSTEDTPLSDVDKLDTNVKDILAQDGFDDAVVAIVEAAIQNPVRMEELRNSLPSLQSLDNETYNELKLTFGKTRDSVIAALKMSGVHAEWKVTSKARGTRYELVIVNQKQVKTAMPTGANQRVTERKRIRKTAVAGENLEWRKAARFSQQVLDSIHSMLSDGQDYKFKRNYIARELAKWIDEDVTVAQGVLNDLIDGELLFVVDRQRGSDILSFNRPAAPVVQRRRTRSPERKTDKTPDTFSAEEQKIAAQICELIASRDAKRISKSQIVSLLNIDDEEGRKLINRLVKTGIVSSETGWERGRAGARRKETAFITFPSKSAFVRFKDNPQDYIAVLHIQQ
jgi:hypothetical protein